MNNYSIEWTIPVKCTLGEAPLWDAHSGLLYWVDILNCKIYRFNKDTNEVMYWETPELVGFIVPLAGETLIAGFKTGLYFVELLADHRITYRPTEIINDTNDQVRINDGIPDKKGCIWFCTMDMNNNDPLGCYYYWNEKDGLQKIDDGYIVANGPAISEDGKKLFTVETVGSAYLKRGIYCLELNNQHKKIDKSLLVDWDFEDSYPDGIVVDQAGNLWVGEFNGNKIRCFNCDGACIATYDLPAWNITKICFGKSGEIYATSALLGTDEFILKNYPLTGTVFCFKIQ